MPLVVVALWLYTLYICIPTYIDILWYKVSYKIVPLCKVVVSKLYVIYIYITSKCTLYTFQYIHIHVYLEIIRVVLGDLQNVVWPY